MSNLIQCDNCNKTIEDHRQDLFKLGWIYNPEYGFDACSNECNEKLCEKHYGEENE